MRIAGATQTAATSIRAWKQLGLQPTLGREGVTSRDHCLNDPKMISNLSKDAGAASISAKEAIENAIAGVVEELGNSHGI